jgi:transcriptional regulator with XRE-family HTH domain
MTDLGPRTYLLEFAQLLRSARSDADLTGRALADRITYSHSRIYRAESGQQLPTWPLTRAYLDGCGVGLDIVHAWHSLWTIARSAERELREQPRKSAERAWFWEVTEQDWQEGLTVIARPDPLLERLLDVSTAQDLGAAIVTLAQRNGAGSLRQLEKQTGIPKSTLHRWYIGKAIPDSAQLNGLLTTLGAPQALQRAFGKALNRIGTIHCQVRHQASGDRCVLGEFHKGPHRAKSGAEWLEDDGVEDVTFPYLPRLQRTPSPRGH